MANSIPLEEVVFEPASLADRAGRVFWWKGHPYRAIRTEYAKFYRDLIETRRVQPLFDRYLVSGGILPLTLHGYGLVIKHDKIPFTSYCVEWNARMLKDAALLISDLSAELLKQNLVLKDAHPWNVLFRAGRPIFIDWGSVTQRERHSVWPYVEFRDRFILPLYLMSARLTWMARLFMLDTLNELSYGEIVKLLLGKIPLRLWISFWRKNHSFEKTCMNVDETFFKSLRGVIEAIPEGLTKTEWTEYEGPGAEFPHIPSENWHPKIENVYNLLIKCKPETVLDIGCNRGWFSELAAKLGAQVIAVDIDESNITVLYERIRQTGLSILPLTMDICCPTPQHGICQSYPAAECRLKADVVLALALSHHLVFKRKMTFEAIAKQLAAFTKKWLIVEFVPPDDQYVSKWMSGEFEWYNLDAFTRALQSFFKKIELLESFPQPRKLLLCER